MMARPSNRKTKLRSASRTTMRDVALVAGKVHPSTVSLALRNSPRVSAKIRTKIQAIAAKIGYRRDPLLDAFNQHRLKIVPQRASRHIAVISDFSSLAELNASLPHAAARVGAMDAAARLHCRIDFFFCGPGQPDSRRLDAVLEARGLRALLLLGVRGEADEMEFSWARQCAVAIDSLQLLIPLYRVTPDYRESTRLLWRNAWTQGSQRIAILRSNAAQPLTEDRAIAGFLLEQMRHPQTTPIPVFTFTHERGCPALFKTWLRAHRPQVILHPALVTKAMLQLLSGESIRCFAFDAHRPTDPGIYPDYTEVGRRAVEHLVTLMQTNQLGPPPAAVCTYVAVKLPV